MARRVNFAVRALATAALTLLVAASPSQAPPDAFFGNQRVLLVVNGSSPFSRALARRYAELRHVPDEHVLVLDDVPGEIAGAAVVPLATATAQIWQPIAGWLRDRGLTDEIDCIVYSSGFPHAVDIGSLPVSKQQYVGSVASLSGMTCFLREVAGGDTSCIRLDANPYAARAGTEPRGRSFGDHPRGRGTVYQSTMLAWLGPFGSGFAEALQQLERSAAADGTDPRGTFYLLQNQDVRATTREPLFAATLAALAARGRSAQRLVAGEDGQDGILPRHKPDVLGAVVGISDFDWSKSGSTIVPGAIVEHLTSFGGTFQAAGQTKLTAFLRAGAAGASGTVTEPYALQAKFPTPLVHVYYADGCTLAEAFHQSVAGPYQLAIVGDACCRPFASLLPWSLPVLPAPWTGTVELPAPAAANASGFEAWLGGTLAATARPGEPLRIDSARFPDGLHTLQLVALGPAPVCVPTSRARQVVVQNHGLSATLQGPTKPVELGQRVVFTGRVPAGADWELRCGTEVLQAGKSPNGAVRADVPGARLGLGRASVRLFASTATGSASSPAVLVTTAVVAVAGTSAAPGSLLPGLAVDVAPDHEPGSRRERRGTLAFADPIDVPTGGRATVRGAFQLAAAGLHEWTVAGGALLALQLDGKRVVAAGKDAEACGPGLVLDLAAGWHTFELELGRGQGQPPRLSLCGPAGSVGFTDATCGQGPFGLDAAPKDKLQPANAAWTDGNRAVAAPPGDDGAAVGCHGALKVGTIAVFFCGLGDAARDLPATIAVETKDSGAWSTVKAQDLRVLRSTVAGAELACLLAAVGGRKTQHVRVRAIGKSPALAHLSEIEIRTGAPK